jgi:hypothetical protein
MSPTTYIRRKAYGDKSWSAKTRESFDINGKLAQLELSTFKDDRGQLVTFASVGFITGPGIVTTAIFGDFFKRLEVTKARCTQKAVAEQQARSVDQWSVVKGAALDYYASKGVAHV